jgi:hypothetical protein
MGSPQGIEFGFTRPDARLPSSRPLRSATIAINGTELTFTPIIPKPQQAILDALRSPDSHAPSE